MIDLPASFMEIVVPPSPIIPGITFTQSDLDAVSDRCRAPRSWLILRGNQIVIKAKPDDSPELSCVVKAVGAILDAANAIPAGDAKASEEK